MKKMIFIVAALLLLGGGGFAVYTFLGGKEAEAAVDPTELSQDKKEAEDAQAKLEADAKIVFVKMDPLTLPVVGKGGVVQIINISVTLEVEDEAKAKEVEKFAPRLKDAYIEEMYGALSQLGDDSVVKIDVIKQHLTKVTKKVLGNDDVRSVLLQAVQQRRA